MYVSISIYIIMITCFCRRLCAAVSMSFVTASVAEYLYVYLYLYLSIYLSICTYLSINYIYLSRIASRSLAADADAGPLSLVQPAADDSLRCL